MTRRGPVVLLMAAAALGQTGRAAAFELAPLLDLCAPSVARETMAALIQVESGGNPNAIGINGADGLPPQPATREDAITAAQGLDASGINYDAGLTQINRRNFEALGLTVETAFEPCANVAAAQRLLLRDYVSADAQAEQLKVPPLIAALSRYNTGRPYAGVSNGYVTRVIDAALVAAVPSADQGQAAVAEPQREPPNDGTNVFHADAVGDVFVAPPGDVFGGSAR